jgi:hypothetical protein
LLLEIPPVLLVDEHKVEVVPRAELLVDVAERRREVEAAEEEADGDGFAWGGSGVSASASAGVKRGRGKRWYCKGRLGVDEKARRHV